MPPPSLNIIHQCHSPNHLRNHLRNHNNRPGVNNRSEGNVPLTVQALDPKGAEPLFLRQALRLCKPFHFSSRATSPPFHIKL